MNSLFEHAWLGWVMLAVIAGLLELLVPSFTFSFISFGAVFSAVCAVWFSFAAQLIVFCLAVLVSLFFGRPLLLKKFHVPHKMHSRSQQLMGMTGVATQSIDAIRATGRVHVNGEDWSARAAQTILEGQKIEVVGSDGIVLLVKEV